MAYKNTVAIIGANTISGTAIAKSMAADYRLLLINALEDKLASLQSTLEKEKDEVDVVNCCKEASWEADIIVITVEEAPVAEVVTTIKEVATCKPVIHFITAANTIEQLQQLLPHAKVVSVLVSQPFINASNADAFIHGRDEETISIAKSIIKAIAAVRLP